MDFHVITPTGPRRIRITLPKVGRIGILTSGGLDSSVMLASILMARKIENPTLPFVALNVKRGFGTEKFTRRMIVEMEDYFDIPIPLEHLDIDPAIPHFKCLTEPVCPLLDNGTFTHVYSADTSNPLEFQHEQAPNRTSVSDQFKFRRWRLPFLHCDKSHIVALMHKMNFSFIEELSHTCFALDEYRCKTCFQCQERAWAYKMLGLTDTGEH